MNLSGACVNQGLTDLRRRTNEDAVNGVLVDEGFELAGVDEIREERVSCIAEGLFSRGADAVVGENVWAEIVVSKNQPCVRSNSRITSTST